MPLLTSSVQEPHELSPLNTSLGASAHSPGPRAQLLNASAASTPLPAKLQSLDEASSVAPMNELLSEVSKHSQAAAPAESVMGASTTQLRREQGSEHELLRSAVKELEIVADVKNVLQGVRAELHQVTGGNWVAARDEQAAELASLSRRIEEGQTKRYGEGSAYERPRTEAEIRADSLRASVLVSQLIDEILPWAIAVGVLLALYHLSRALLNMQAARQLKAVRSARQAGAASSPSSASRGTDTGTRLHSRSGGRSGSRNGNRNGSRSQRRWL